MTDADADPAPTTEPAEPTPGRQRRGGQRRGGQRRDGAGRGLHSVPQRDEAGIAAYVERLGDALTEAGMPRLASRVFARLLAEEDGRMTAADLTEALAVSPAAISGAVRYLTQTSLIGKRRERGSRRDIYVVEVDAWHRTMLGRNPMVLRLETSFQSGVTAVGGTDTVAGRRLQLSVEFLELLRSEMSRLQEVWEARKAEIMAGWPPPDDDS